MSNKNVTRGSNGGDEDDKTCHIEVCDISELEKRKLELDRQIIAARRKGEATLAPSRIEVFSQVHKVSIDTLMALSKQYFIVGLHRGKADKTLYLPGVGGVPKPSQNKIWVHPNLNGRRENKTKGRKPIAAPAAKFDQMRNTGPLVNGVEVFGPIADAVKGAAKVMLNHREIISDVGGEGLQNALIRLAINPGLGLMEMLSQVSKSWTQYAVKSFKVWYEPAVATDTDGQVMLAPDYNPNEDVALDSLTSAEALKHIGSYYDAVSTPLWDACVMHTDAKAIMSTGTRKFIRSGNVAEAKDRYDAFSLLIKTHGLPNELVMGQVWVDYEIELFQPALDHEVGSAFTTVLRNTFNYVSNSTSNFNIIGYSQCAFFANPFGLKVAGSTEATEYLVLPKGAWKFEIQFDVRSDVNTNLLDQSIITQNVYYDDTGSLFDTQTAMGVNHFQHVLLDAGQSINDFGAYAVFFAVAERDIRWQPTYTNKATNSSGSTVDWRVQNVKLVVTPM